MKNPFKSIWNFLILKFKGNEKKTISKDEQSDTHRVATESQPERVHAPEKPKEEIRFAYQYKMSFRKQQLIGKVLTFRKDRFRIHKSIGIKFGRFQYIINQL